MSQRQGYRQGDVELIRVDDNQPTKLMGANQRKPNAKGQMVVAEGEQTGHAHWMESEVAKLFTSTALPSGHQLLVLQEATVKRGDFIEGKVLETMPDGTIRFEQTDGTITRFMPDDIDIQSNGVKVLRAYAPLKHDEHDAIPVSAPGTYRVIQHHTVTSRNTRMVVGD